MWRDCGAFVFLLIGLFLNCRQSRAFFGSGRPVRKGFRYQKAQFCSEGCAASRASSAKAKEAFGDRPGTRAELLWSGIGFFAVYDLDNDEFETKENVRPRPVRIELVIGIDRIEGDITFSADLVIGAAREFEMDR